MAMHVTEVAGAATDGNENRPILLNDPHVFSSPGTSARSEDALDTVAPLRPRPTSMAMHVGSRAWSVSLNALRAASLAADHVVDERSDHATSVSSLTLVTNMLPI